MRLPIHVLRAAYRGFLSQHGVHSQLAAQHGDVPVRSCPTHSPTSGPACAKNFHDLVRVRGTGTVKVRVKVRVRVRVRARTYFHTHMHAR